jgi:hypothetical protein
MGAHIKKSFGTALKFIDKRNPAASSAMVVCGALMLFVVPSTHTFVDGISSRSLWAGLQQRLMPDDYWFGLFVERGRLAATPPEAAEQATGSIPAPTATDAAEKAAP